MIFFPFLWGGKKLKPLYFGIPRCSAIDSTSAGFGFWLFPKHNSRNNCPSLGMLKMWFDVEIWKIALDFIVKDSKSPIWAFANEFDMASFQDLNQINIKNSQKCHTVFLLEWDVFDRFAFHQLDQFHPKIFVHVGRVVVSPSWTAHGVGWKVLLHC